ncbi:hypothetical protein [Aridibaculum aurantiacum]|uniref:hypothetical protein n=1 Tax=Aridibaculum aurantiacum TaxID=2810307 RepID=UPI001A965E2B|nr:hypothetical protein [Aridibaculum aurantiacum]
MDFELFVDGTVEVKALPNEAFSEETIMLFAEVHKTFINYHRIRNNQQDLLELAVMYFENKGFEIKENGVENTMPPEAE